MGAVPWYRRRVARLAGLTIGMVPLVLAGLLIGYWVRDHVPPWAYWELELGFLIGLEALYVASLIASLVAIPVLGRIAYRARRRGASRPSAARGLLLSVAVLFGSCLTELGAGMMRLLAAPGTPPAIQEPSRGEELRAGPPRLGTEDVRFRTEFPGPADDREVNLVVLGESSAEGVPYHPWLSIGKIVAWRLEQILPNRRVHLEILATSGDTLQGQCEKLARLTRRPDALIVYSGHNEFSARFPWSRSVEHYLDRRPSPAWQALTGSIERTSMVCGLIRRAADKCRIAIPPPRQTSRPLVDVPVYTPAEYGALLADFRRRLESLVRHAGRIGAIPILIVPPGNDAGFEPNRSFLPAATTYRDREEFERAFQDARRLELSDPDASIERYRALLARQPGFAAAHYRLARLLERAGGRGEAYRHDIAARDHDGLPMRCPTPFQDAYRRVAERYPCILIDAQSYFHAIGRDGLLGDDLFHDMMHPSIRGQIALAQAVLQGLHARRAFGWPPDDAAPLVDPASCAAHFGLGRDQWPSLCLWGAQMYDWMAPLGHDPRRRRAKRDAFLEARDRILAGQSPETVGLPNVGIPPAVPTIPGAAILSGPDPGPGPGAHHP
jgi:hypothetical protein